MRASKSVYHPNGDADNFQTVEDALDLLKPFSGFLSYFVELSAPGADRILFWDDSATGVTWLSLSGMTISGTSLSVNAATTSTAGIIEQAVASEYQANTSGNLALTPAEVWNATAYTALTDGTTIAVDMSTGFNFSVSIAGNRTLSNPTHAKIGQAGCFAVTAAAADRTLNVDTNYKKTTAITFPITIKSGKKAYLFYFQADTAVTLITAVLNNPA